MHDEPEGDTDPCNISSYCFFIDLGLHIVSALAFVGLAKWNSLLSL